MGLPSIMILPFAMAITRGILIPDFQTHLCDCYMWMIYQHTLSKGILKSNFRQYGQMEKQRWEESEKRKGEERRSEKRKAEERRSRCAKGRKNAKHCVFPMFCGSGVCRKSARCCGGKHISKSKCESTHHVRTTFGCSTASHYTTLQLQLQLRLKQEQQEQQEQQQQQQQQQEKVPLQLQLQRQPQLQQQ